MLTSQWFANWYLLFPYTTLFRSGRDRAARQGDETAGGCPRAYRGRAHRSEPDAGPPGVPPRAHFGERSEEHTSELQSHSDLVCRLLLEKKDHIHVLARLRQDVAV